MRLLVEVIDSEFEVDKCLSIFFPDLHKVFDIEIGQQRNNAFF
jgi:hypothetical protein